MTSEQVRESIDAIANAGLRIRWRDSSVVSGKGQAGARAARRSQISSVVHRFVHQPRVWRVLLQNRRPARRMKIYDQN
jgi:hypothetical protein